MYGALLTCRRRETLRRLLTRVPALVRASATATRVQTGCG